MYGKYCTKEALQKVPEMSIMTILLESFGTTY